MLSFHWICLFCHVQNALIEACLFMATIKETSRTAPSTSRESYALIAAKLMRCFHFLYHEDVEKERTGCFMKLQILLALDGDDDV